MKKVVISGIAKVYGTKETDGDYARVELNGIQIDNLLAAHLLKGEALDGEKYIDETDICKVNIIIEPCAEMLSVNGKEMALEL